MAADPRAIIDIIEQAAWYGSQATNGSGNKAQAGVFTSLKRPRGVVVDQSYLSFGGHVGPPIASSSSRRVIWMKGKGGYQPLIELLTGPDT